MKKIHIRKIFMSAIVGCGVLVSQSLIAAPSPQAMKQQQLQQQAMNLANSLSRQLNDMKFSQGAYKNGATARDYGVAEAAARKAAFQLMDMGLNQYDPNLQRAMRIQSELSQTMHQLADRQQKQQELIKAQNSPKALQVARDIMNQSNANLKNQVSRIAQQSNLVNSLEKSKNKAAYQNALTQLRNMQEQYSAMQRAASQATTNYNNILKYQSNVVTLPSYGNTNTIYR